MNNAIAIKIGGIFLTLTGLGMLAAAVFFLFSNTWFWISAESTKGKVIGWSYMLDHKQSWVPEEQRSRKSRIKFNDASGNEILFATDIGASNELYKLGETVTVLYRKNDPQDAMIKDFKTMYLGPTLLLPFGLVFGILGVLVKTFAEAPPSKRKEQ